MLDRSKVTRAAAAILCTCLGGCSSSPNPSSSSGAGAPLDVTGTWRLCESGASDDPGGFHYVAPGGVLLDLTQQQGSASASEIGGDGGVVELSTGWINDAGFLCDGGSCGDTTVLLGGPFDPVSRVWSAGFLWPHRDDTGATIETYPARLTFSADGQRFTGIIDDGSGGASLFGGREDGSFTCAVGAGGTGSDGRCGGTPSCESPPCAEGCVLIVASDPVYDSCSPEGYYCQSLSDQQSCERANGCSWSP